MLYKPLIGKTKVLDDDDPHNTICQDKLCFYFCIILQYSMLPYNFFHRYDEPSQEFFI